MGASSVTADSGSAAAVFDSGQQRFSGRLDQRIHIIKGQRTNGGTVFRKDAYHFLVVVQEGNEFHKDFLLVIKVLLWSCYSSNCKYSAYCSSFFSAIAAFFRITSA